MAKAAPVPALDPHDTLLHNARVILAVRVAEMFGFAHAIGNPAEVDDLHNMRIAAKRLRYTLEMFRPVLGPDGPAVIDLVKEVQERIGIIHDADVLSVIAREHLAVVAQRQVDMLAGAGTAGVGEDDERVGAVRAALALPDLRLGLAVLLARTRASRDREYVALTAWWAEHGGAQLRVRLDAVAGND